MADAKLKAYGTAATITLTATSLAAGAYRQSTAVDNETNLYLNAQVGGIIQVGALSADGTFEFFAYGSHDGTNYSAGLTGSDGTITWGTTGSTGVDGYLNLKPLGSVAIDTTDDNKDVVWGPFDVAGALGLLVLPRKWGIVYLNNTNATSHATGTNNAQKFSPIVGSIA